MLKKLLVIKIVLVVLLLVVYKIYGQGRVDILDYQYGTEKFYKAKENYLYKVSDFNTIDEIKKEELSKSKAYFRVFYDDEGRVISSGYYTREYDGDKGVELVKLTQYVNAQNLPYYVIRYEYNFLETPTLVSEKYYKGLTGRVISYNRYSWDEKTENLKRVEKYGNNIYSNEMELTGSYNLIWKGKDVLSRIIFYDDSNKKIEQYTFGEGFKPKNILREVDRQNMSIGNNQIYIGHISRYERYEPNTTNILYYILYKREGEGLREEKYNPDRTLLHEKFYKFFKAEEEEELK